jgi:hypothetical protein
MIRISVLSNDKDPEETRSRDSRHRPLGLLLVAKMLTGPKQSHYEQSNVWKWGDIISLISYSAHLSPSLSLKIVET